MDILAQAKYKATIEAKIIRADGTEEDLGEISQQTVTGQAARKIKKLFKSLL
jgi:hypothetical protein